MYILFFFSYFANAQKDIVVKATFQPEENVVIVSQEITITNEFSTPQNSLYLLDWNNSFVSTKTELAERFADEYVTKFHFSKDAEKGYTDITSITDGEANDLFFTRNKEDIIMVNLSKALNPKEQITLKLKYKLQLPATKFTRFGITPEKDIRLKNWFITPAKQNDKWLYYSNKNLDDLYLHNSDIELEITFPNSYNLVSNFDLLSSVESDNTTTATINGNNRITHEIHLVQKPEFISFETDKFTYVTNIDDEGIGIGLKAVIHDKIAFFMDDVLGQYPYKKILLSNSSYKQNPVYGLNQLPDFIRPFPDGFQYELKILKATINKYVKNTFNTNPREDFWLNDAIENYLMIKYIEEHYPNIKILGNLAKIWGIRSFEIAKKKFNDQYDYTNQYMARINLDQAIHTRKDSLLKFNVNIANKNKAGIGLDYLDDYLGNDIIEESIKEFYTTNNLKDIKSKDFIDLVQSKTEKDISWFIKDYINTDKRIDYTILDAVKLSDSLAVTLKNNNRAQVPISIYEIKDKKIIGKHYTEGFTGTTTINLPNNDADRLVLNYEGIIPELNQRNNTKTIKPHLFNKPLKFTFLKDAEAPKHNQIFYVPQLGYNLYDGLSPGLRFTNKAILKKPFTYSVKPLYGLTSKKLVGSVSLLYTQYLKQRDLFSVNYGLTYQRYHYEDDLMYRKFNPYIIFLFKNKNDLRDNFKQRIIARNVTVHRDKSTTVVTEEPNYNVFNLNYSISDKNLVDFYAINTDMQFASKFSKISASFEYRKIFQNNRQINLRVFAGGFLHNDTNSDFFSFALDRPTDYLFDYNYYGRSESTGIYSQQIIIAEGGFKSKLNDALANEWITTLNASTNIWKYIFAYGDVGFVGNSGDTSFVYDSGVHLNLVPDYFELFFPVYSNLGWEIGQPKYQEKIRFKVVLTPKALIGLFTRKWH